MKRLLIVLILAALTACRDETKSSPAPSATPVPTPIPTPTPTPTPAAAKKPAPLPGFAGFSKDGKTFAWVDNSATGADVRWSKKVTVGDKQPKQSILDADLDAGGGALAKEGFTSERKAAPADLTLETELTAKPPKIFLKRGDKTTTVPQGDFPYPPTDSAEIWGVSADGKYAAIHIAGPDVPGVFSKGGKGILHFVFMAAVP